MNHPQPLRPFELAMSATTMPAMIQKTMKVMVPPAPPYVTALTSLIDTLERPLREAYLQTL